MADHWTFDAPPDGHAWPRDLAALIVSWANSQQFFDQVRASADELTCLLEALFQASLEVDEGRSVRLQVVLTDRPRQVTVAFKVALEATAHNLVKLAPSIGLGSRWLTIEQDCAERTKFGVVGICDPKLCELFQKRFRNTTLAGQKQEFSGLRLSVLGPGWIRSQMMFSSFDLRRCSFEFPFSIDRVDFVDAWHREAASEIGQFTPNDNWMAVCIIARSWCSIIRKLRDSQHGGTILIVPNGASLDGLLGMNYAMYWTGLAKLVAERAPTELRKSFEFLTPADKHWTVGDEIAKSERELARAEDLVASLASFDGAVVIRRNLTVEGCGAEILPDSFAGDDEVIRYGQQPSGIAVPDRPLKSFGMRHRSAYRFTQKVPQSIAFVVSQDGHIHIFFNDGARTIAINGAIPDQWCFPSVAAPG